MVRLEDAMVASKEETMNQDTRTLVGNKWRTGRGMCPNQQIIRFDLVRMAGYIWYSRTATANERVGEMKVTPSLT